jgi:hypothetical protein
LALSDQISTSLLKKLFRFPFQGTDWQGRLAIGSVLVFAGSFVPIVPMMFVGGYVLRVMRQTIAGQPPTLPEWDDWGGLAGDGLKVFVIGLVYFLPAVIVYVVGMILYFVTAVYLPLATAAGTEETEAMANVMVLILGSLGAMFLSIALGTVLLILGAVALPMATAHFCAEGRLGAAFRLRQWWRVLKRDKLGYFIAWVIVAGLMAVLYAGSMLLYSTMILCFVIPFLTAPISFYLSLVGAALFGETYREAAAVMPSEVEIEEN